MFAVVADAIFSVFDTLGLTSFFSSVLGFFSVSGPLFSFFAWVGKKIAVKSLVLPFQFSLLGALVVARIAYFSTFLALVVYLYNQFHIFINFFSSSNIFSSSSSFLAISWQVLESVGFVDALFNSLHSLTFVWFSALILILSKYFVKTLKVFSDEFFKISLLMTD